VVVQILILYDVKPDNPDHDTEACIPLTTFRLHGGLCQQ
jgi:hypothetical protein